jgi:CHASE2 domain-containing sensor protein
MFSERSWAVLEALPESAAYPVALGCLLLGSSFAFATNHDVLGAAGVLLLCVLSLAYGALQMPEHLE